MNPTLIKDLPTDFVKSLRSLFMFRNSPQFTAEVQHHYSLTATRQEVNSSRKWRVNFVQ